MEEYNIAKENGQICYLAGKIVLQNRFTGDLVTALYNEENTRVLLNLYGENQDKVGQIPLNPFSTEKERWDYITQEYSRMRKISVTTAQLKDQLTNVMEQTKDEVTNYKILKAAGRVITIRNGVQIVDRQILNSGPAPAIFILKQIPAITRPSYPAKNTDTSPPRKTRKCAAERIFDRFMDSNEIRFRIREANRERKHKEQMKKLSEIISTLQQNRIANQQIADKND